MASPLLLLLLLLVSCGTAHASRQGKPPGARPAPVFNGTMSASEHLEACRRHHIDMGLLYDQQWRLTMDADRRGANVAAGPALAGGPLLLTLPATHGGAVVPVAPAPPPPPQGRSTHTVTRQVPHSLLPLNERILQNASRLDARPSTWAGFDTLVPDPQPPAPRSPITCRALSSRRASVSFPTLK